jgi:hypothetical protein
LNLSINKLLRWKGMVSEDVMVDVKVSRSNGEITYSVDCASNLSNDELEYYLKEIIKGICSWKPGVCMEQVKHFKGKINRKK